MKIYFVRHGQTDYNYQRLIQGRIDAPLNKIGIKQAKDTGKLLKSLDFKYDKIVSSPLSRAFKTAHLISRKMNYKDNIVVHPYFVERNFGNYELQPIVPTFDKLMEDGFKEPGFEDSESLIKRIKKGIDLLYVDYKNKTIIATVHAHVIRSAYILVDSEKYDYTTHYLGNCSIHVFNYDGNKLTVETTYNNEEE